MRDLLQEFISTRNAGIWLNLEFPDWRWRNWVKKPHKYVQVQEYIMTDQRYNQWVAFIQSRGYQPDPVPQIVPEMPTGSEDYTYYDPRQPHPTGNYGGAGQSGGSTGGSTGSSSDPNTWLPYVAIAAVILLISK